MFEVEDTHFWYRGMRTISKMLLGKFISRKKGNRILDAGCGTGSGIIFLQQYGKVDGFDISKQAVRFCHLRGLKQVITGTIDRIPYKDNTFDIVTCFDVLYHQKVESDIKSMKELYRVLKPGGILLLRIAANNWLFSYHDVAVHTRHRYNSDELRGLLEKTKLQVLTLTYANMFFSPVIVTIRFIEKFLRSKKSNQSDVNKVNPIVNMACYVPFLIESILIKYLSLPFGLSIIGVAKKPSGKKFVE